LPYVVPFSKEIPFHASSTSTEHIISGG
jgi:hypothetical protein